ncbi:energy transducer TonB [Acinetobacter baumannii]|uniref:energy transducer TonB n=1 Tax=Acinetobacter baumannii TaxID=470 RepID=UPI00028E40F5|nr:energy transducer TonB [Acinetobacter baumannii]AGQ08027.1 Periplasmic protein TonB, links inner and outer membranes [Acinetobacter baumannii BJAB0715]AIY35837.1 TonB-dependent receptor [Acinetobacter baumannii LAC-4]AKQ29291.1 energy transducer TonB [Acinetobacter baumannii]AMN02929.1 energy transducer TonB [Acinetobacter baumannii]APO57119.1 energy transducer TonB [Acinetobacter baumannii]
MLKKRSLSIEPFYYWWQDRVFIAAIILAILLHIFVLLIHFAMPAPSEQSTKEIAITIRPTEDVTKHADFLAQADQQGSGAFREAHWMSSNSPAPMPSDASTGEAQLETLEKVQQQRELKFEEKVLMTVLSWQKQAEKSQRKKALEQLQSQFQAKAAMVASLEAQYLQRQQDFSRQQKIKTVDGIQAKKDASAAYLDKFREKVELYGNRYYPEEAKQQQLKGEVRLMVILNAQGGIRAIRLLESSGHPVLDEAAKASVRRGAPFGRFDANMKDISELRIIRTWRFDPAEAEFEVH